MMVSLCLILPGKDIGRQKDRDEHLVMFSLGLAHCMLYFSLGVLNVFPFNPHTYPMRYILS
jgi:hypothetical protein